MAGLRSLTGTKAGAGVTPSGATASYVGDPSAPTTTPGASTSVGAQRISIFVVSVVAAGTPATSGARTKESVPPPRRVHEPCSMISDETDVGDAMIGFSAWSTASASFNRLASADPGAG